jgi:hypothetical protein
LEPSLSATNSSTSNGAKLVKAIWYCGAASLTGTLVARTAIVASRDMPRALRMLIHDGTVSQVMVFTTIMMRTRSLQNPLFRNVNQLKVSRDEWRHGQRSNGGSDFNER